jgi:hypothetical protein
MANDGQQLSATTLADRVRNYVHFDNLAATFSRQAQQARTARARWEEQILQYLNENKMANAIIQIAGGRLTVHEEKHAQPLTLQRLECLLHDYFNESRPAGTKDETDDIMTYIKKHRAHTVETRIKKS